MRVQVASGPLEGVGLRGEPGVRRGPAQAWIRADGTVSASPAPGRLLHRLVDDAYFFAGNTHARCECGTYFKLAEGGQERQPCPMCGATPETTT